MRVVCLLHFHSAATSRTSRSGPASARQPPTGPTSLRRASGLPRYRIQRLAYLNVCHVPREANGSAAYLRGPDVHLRSPGVHAWVQNRRKKAIVSPVYGAPASATLPQRDMVLPFGNMARRRRSGRWPLGMLPTRWHRLCIRDAPSVSGTVCRIPHLERKTHESLLSRAP